MTRAHHKCDGLKHENDLDDNLIKKNCFELVQSRKGPYMTEKLLIGMKSIYSNKILKQGKSASKCWIMKIIIAFLIYFQSV